MSLRGRVLQRSPYSPDARAASYQSQLNQYKFLGRILHVPQFGYQSWITANGFQSDLKKTGQMVLIKDKYKSWTGRPGAVALVVPVQQLTMLNCIWMNAATTQVPAGCKNGWVIKTGDDTWIDATNTWAQSGYISSGDAVEVTVTATKDRFVQSVGVGAEMTANGREWVISGKTVKEVYFVCPFFEITMKGNNDVCQQVLVYEKSY